VTEVSSSDLRSRFRQRAARACWATLTTPFAADGSVDEPALRANLRVYAGHFCPDYPIGFVACGTYGESLAMSDAERRAVIRATVDEAGDRIPVIAAILNGDSCLERTLEMVSFCEELGVDAVAIAPPTYYFKPTIAGVEGWFSILARKISAGLVLYNLAGRFGYYLQAHDVARLVGTVPALVGMKLVAPSRSERIEMIETLGDVITVIEGAEPNAPDSLQAGAVSYMASSAVFAPALMVEWSRAIIEADAHTLSTLQQRFVRYRRLQIAVAAEPPSLLKAAMDTVGLAGGPVRPPLTPLSTVEQRELSNALQDLGLPIPISQASQHRSFPSPPQP
jgi:4-hydroxy-tetrahydrodipicolinate synthase